MPVNTANLIRLRTMTRNRLGVPASDGFHTPVLLDEDVNLAIDELQSEQRWPWNEAVDTITTVAGTAAYDVPSDWRATRSIIDAEGRELALMSVSDIYMYPSSSQGRPEAYCLYGDQVRIGPIPDTAYTLTHLYYKRHLALVQDTDAMTIPAEYAGVVAAKAAELASLRADDRSAAAAHAAEYLTGLTRIKREVRRATKPIQVRVRPGAWY